MIGIKYLIKNITRHLKKRLVQADAVVRNPTLVVPPGYYSFDRAQAVYGEAFRRCFDYVVGSGIKGDIFEFGTMRGFTARIIANLMREYNSKSHLFLFDSFEGLPDIESEIDQSCYEVAVNKAWFKGQMSLPAGIERKIQKELLQKIPYSQLTIVKGYFEKTLDEYLPKSKASIIHIDCDLYSSAKLVLDKIVEKELIQDGCVILFDDWNCNRANPEMGERKALKDSRLSDKSRFDYSLFFTYGWHAQAFFVHDKEAIRWMK